METLIASAAEDHVALESLCASVLEDTDALDEHGFDLFDIAVKHISSPSHSCAEALLVAVSEHAAAREAYCMVMEAFATLRAPPLQLLLLKALANVLPRLSANGVTLWRRA